MRPWIIYIKGRKVRRIYKAHSSSGWTDGVLRTYSACVATEQAIEPVARTKPMSEEQTLEPPKARRGRKRLLFAALLLVAIIGGLSYLALPAKEPSYNGQSLSHWLQQYEEFQWSDPPDPKLVESKDALRHIGTNAIPTLLRMLRAHDSALKTKLMDWNDEHDFLHLHFTPAEEQQTLALTGFTTLGQLASNAIPAVIAIYNHASSQNDRTKLFANEVLMGIYPAPGVANPYWAPPGERCEWFVEAGKIRFRLQDFTNAVSAFSEAIKLEPTNVYAYDLRSTVRMQYRDWTGAIADTKKILEIDPTNHEAFYTQGLCKFSLKDFKGAEADLTSAIKLNTNNANAYSCRGLARANQRKIADAVADFDKAIAMDPSDPSHYRNRAAVEVLQQELELALEDCSKAVDLTGKDPYIYFVRGNVKFSLKDYPAAVTDFDRAIELNSKEAAYYAARAYSYVFMDNFENANADLAKALQLNPKSVIIYAVRGVLQAKRNEDDGALADFEHAVELGDQPADTHTLLGLFQYKAGKRGPALENCRKALQLRSDQWGHTEDLTAYIWLIRAQSGEEKEANAELEARLKAIDGMKTKRWEACIARYFSGQVAESNFLGQATTTARRPSAVRGQVSESYYYVGMKHKLAGDKPGAAQMFQKCLDMHEDNNLGYMNAWMEMKASKAK